MRVYRIAKKKERAEDLSGIGAYNAGGRWNNTGVFALYTSENRALAMLEVLVHVEESELPPYLYIMTIDIDDKAPIYKVEDTELPPDWRVPENIALKNKGDSIFKARKHLGIRARSAVLPEEYNYILNPFFPRYYDLVKIVSVEEYHTDDRLT